MVFDLRNSKIYASVKAEKNFLLRGSKFLRNFFLILFLVFLVPSLQPGWLFLGLFLIFWNLNFFLETEIKKTGNPGTEISVAVENPGNYNLAEFLDFESAQVVDEALNFCKKRKIQPSGLAVLYSALKFMGDINAICYRLGLLPEKLKSDVKNCLEKGAVSESLNEVIARACKVAVERGSQFVCEKDILISLAQGEQMLSEVLANADLKPEDVKNLALWIDSAERSYQKSKEFWTAENLALSGSLAKDWASGYTITLDRFSIDWRKVVSKWAFREIIGHKKEIEEVEVILAKQSGANVLLVGEPGAGRKSIVQALAQKCYLHKSLPNLNDKRIMELDVVLLAAQIPDFDKLEATLDQIFSEVLASGNTVLVIDDMENFVGQKVQKAGAVDISGVLSKYLPLPDFPFVGITTYEGLHAQIERDSSFAGLFQKVEVKEVFDTETLMIVQNSALEFEHSRRVFVMFPAVREIINLTARYMPSLPFPKKALDILDETIIYAQKKKEKTILPHHVAEVISQKTGIPVGKMDAKEKEVLLNLENLIHNRIVGQDEAVSQIAIAMRRARSGIGSKNRPMGTFLFLGPTGVGKTETAKALSEIYFGGETKMIRLDMSEFQDVSDIPRLLGAVSPVEMQGLLTTPVREKPFSLVLLDEIEKAHRNILNLLLQVLDEGFITDGQGRKVIFSNTIIICTSNAGADMIFKKTLAGEKLEKNQLLDSLFEKQLFRPEFINRFDATVIFHPLTRENLLQIAELTLQSLKKRLKEKNIDFQITESLKEKVVELSYKPEFGAREMRRVVQDKIENTIAEALLSEQVKKNDLFEINPETFQLEIKS